jgi:secreted trypsin-like serine protease
MSRRLLVVACLWAVVLLVPAASSSKSNEVGGQPVSVAQAPWAVLVASSAGACSGSLIDPTHVLTAAHCEYDDNGNPVAPTAMSVLTGASDYRQAVTGDVAQWVQVASYRIHPAWAHPTAGVHYDDVAVLALASPVTLGPDVQTIALPPPSTSLSTGETADLFGFGQEAPPAFADGHLYELGLSVDDQSQCVNDGSDDAVWICASAPTGAPCFGDSGGGLVLSGPTPVLVGVMVWVHDGCPAGSTSGFANLLTPEIADFVRGSDNPPLAPRLSARASLGSNEEPDVGTKLTCNPGQWSGSPTSYTYTFVDSSTQAVLQSGSTATYV